MMPKLTKVLNPIAKTPLNTQSSMSSSVAEDSANQHQESSVLPAEAPLQLTISASSTPARATSQGFLGFTPKGNPEVSQSGNQIAYIESQEGRIYNPPLLTSQAHGVVNADPFNTPIHPLSRREVQVVDSAGPPAQAAYATQTNRLGQTNMLTPSLPVTSLPVVGANPRALATNG